MLTLLFLLLPVAAFSGWCWGHRNKSSAKKNLSHDYFVGLKYLIDEQPDKAIDIFVKMLEVNSDTVETHLALGSLFRRRGEVNRAIHIHQNVIARPQLAKSQRLQALAELAQDYMRAGLFDRAEKLFAELIRSGIHNIDNFRYLLNIYEQQKDWRQAIVTAKKLEKNCGIQMRTAIAHYYCELDDSIRALSVDKNCVRASLQRGDFYMDKNDFNNAIKFYKKVYVQDPEYICEIVAPLEICYEKLGDQRGFINYLQNCLKKYPRVSIVLALAKILQKHEGDVKAIEFIIEQIKNYPSLRALDYLTSLYINNAEDNTKNELLLLRNIMNELLGDKPFYRCIHCGFASKILSWYCPGCRKWSSIKPIHGLEGD